MSETNLFDATIDDIQSVLEMRNSSRLVRIPEAMSSVRLDDDIVSTSKDCLRFIEAFMSGELFPKEYLAEMQSWHPLFIPLEAGVGMLRFQLPWFFAPFQERLEFVGHSGISGAFAFYNADKDIFCLAPPTNCRATKQDETPVTIKMRMVLLAAA